MSKIQILRDKYLEILKHNIKKNPNDYPWLQPQTIISNVGSVQLKPKTPEEFADKCISSIPSGNFTIDRASAPTLRSTVKALGIKPTKKALLEWISNDSN